VFVSIHFPAKLQEDDRNQIQKGVDWQFSTDEASIKLKHLYLLPIKE
jgi:hypothetical protein